MKSALRSTGMTVLVFALLGSAQLAASSGDGDTGTLSLERPGTGTPVCGLGREFHAGRRAELRKRVEQGLLLFRGLPDTRGYTRFHQDKVFWYLTGVESPNSALLMDAKSGREILFVARADRRKESWEGEVWDADDEWVRELSGFEEVLPITELEPTLAKLVRKQRTVWVSTTPWVALAGCVDRAGPHDRSRTGDAFDGRPSREERLVQVLEQEFKAKVKDVSPILDDMRRVKTVEEIAAMRRAGRAGGLAIAEAMRSTHPDVGEWELEALMTFVQIREGAAGPAYHGIVGSGANSNVLHYSASARRMQAGEVILVDYGPEVDHYTTDITRTWPVSGSFTPEMAEMYDAVLAAQAAGIAAVKPGATMGEISRMCSRVLRERGYGDLIRHGACHYIGLEVHDVGAGSAPFEPGVAFTVEPGIYDDETGIGIRIEDVVIVTEDGCEIVSGAAPKDRKLIEALMRERGLMDGMADRAKSWRK